MVITQERYDCLSRQVCNERNNIHLFKKSDNARNKIMSCGSENNQFLRIHTGRSDEIIQTEIEPGRFNLDMPSTSIFDMLKEFNITIRGNQMLRSNNFGSVVYLLNKWKSCTY